MGHGGSGRGAFVIASIRDFMNDYKDMLQKIIDSNFSINNKDTSIAEAEVRIKKAYIKFIEFIKQFEDLSYYPKIDALKMSQKKWEEYVEDNCVLFSILNKNISNDQWRIFFVEKRIKDFEDMTEYFVG